MATSAATPPEPTRDECSYASVSHFLQMGTAFIGPLVIFAIKRESRFVKFHALQAVLLQIIFFVAMMISMVLWMGVMFGTVLAHQQQGTQANQAPPLVPFIIFPFIWLAWMGGWVTMLVLAIVYGIKANRGEWANYPLLGNLARRLLHM